MPGDPTATFDPIDVHNANRVRSLITYAVAAAIAIPALFLAAQAVLADVRNTTPPPPIHPNDATGPANNAKFTESTTIWLDDTPIPVPCTSNGPGTVTHARERRDGNWTIAGTLPSGIACPGSPLTNCQNQPWAAVIDTTTKTITYIDLPAGTSEITAVLRDEIGDVTVSAAGTACTETPTTSGPDATTTTVTIPT